MKSKYILLTLAVVAMLFILWYLLSIENSPQTAEESIQYPFPVSRDIPKPKPEPTPVYDIPSTTLPEPEPEQSTPEPEPIPTQVN